jgi:hypothetical protein
MSGTSEKKGGDDEMAQTMNNRRLGHGFFSSFIRLI